MRPATLLVLLALFASSAAAQPSRLTEASSATAAPPGAESLGVEWRSATVPGVGTILMAVARPAGKGSFPAVVLLHGSYGFAREYVQLARELSRDGVVAVAPCWFAPGEGAGLKFVSPLTCPAGAPLMSEHQGELATRTIDAVLREVRTLPGVQPDRVALFGHSRGGGAAWNYVLHGGQAQAIILNSAGYPDEIIQNASKFSAPVLILHGRNDTIGPMTRVQRAHAFELALRRSGKPVDAVYYPAGEHGSLFVSPSQHADEVQRMKIFLRRHLRPN